MKPSRCGFFFGDGKAVWSLISFLLQHCYVIAGWLLAYGGTLSSWWIIYSYNSFEFVWWLVYHRFWNKTEAGSDLAYGSHSWFSFDFPVGRWIWTWTLNLWFWNSFTLAIFFSVTPTVEAALFFCCSPNYHLQFSKQKPLHTANKFSGKASKIGMEWRGWDIKCIYLHFW